MSKWALLSGETIVRLFDHDPTDEFRPTIRETKTEEVVVEDEETGEKHTEQRATVTEKLGDLPQEIVLRDVSDIANVDVGWQLQNGKVVPFQVPKDDLIQHANAKQWSLATGGYQTKCGDATITFETTAEAYALMTSKMVRLLLPNPPETINWQTGPIDFAALSADEFRAACAQVGDFIDATFDALEGVFAHINSGDITSREEVDAYAWPSNVDPSAQPKAKAKAK